MKIAILQINLGSYFIYWEQFYQSSEDFFCKEDIKHYFVFTDNKNLLQKKNVTYIEQDFLGFPFSTLFRYHMFLRIKSKLEEYDYIVFFNANFKFLKKINCLEFFGIKNKKIVAGLHPLFINVPNSNYPTEKRKDSKCKIFNPSIYVQGCINGGQSKEFIFLMEKMKVLIDQDLTNGILTKWWDEAYWNFLINDYYQNKRDKLHILTSDYLCPENQLTDKTKIMQISKSDDFDLQEKQFNYSIKTLIKFLFIKIQKKVFSYFKEK